MLPHSLLLYLQSLSVILLLEIVNSSINLCLAKYNFSDMGERESLVYFNFSDKGGGADKIIFFCTNRRERLRGSEGVFVDLETDLNWPL